jgi:hypothetical protein
MAQTRGIRPNWNEAHSSQILVSLSWTADRHGSLGWLAILKVSKVIRGFQRQEELDEILIALWWSSIKCHCNMVRRRSESCWFAYVKWLKLFDLVYRRNCRRAVQQRDVQQLSRSQQTAVNGPETNKMWLVALEIYYICYLLNVLFCSSELQSRWTVDDGVSPSSYFRQAIQLKSLSQTPNP